MISFIVPAYNEELLLGPTLSAIRSTGEALPEAYEIVVADDGSSDRTAEVAAAQGARVVRVQHRHIAATRNAGARAARGQLLVFVDADTLITGRVMRRAVEAVRAGAVGGGATVRFDGQLPLYFRALLAATVAFSRVTRLSFGCFLFCTRSAFDAAGGFDEQLYAGEEIALSRALKRQGRFLILRDPVTTSGRKLRTHSTGEVLRAIGWVSLHLIRPRRDRRGLEAWYGERRHDR